MFERVAWALVCATHLICTINQSSRTDILQMRIYIIMNIGIKKKRRTGIDDMSRVTSASREAVEEFMKNVDIGTAAAKDYGLDECIPPPLPV